MIFFDKFRSEIKFQFLKYRALKPLYKFIINGIFMFAIWAIFFQFFRHAGAIHNFYEYSTYKLTSIYLNFSRVILELFGYEIIISGKIIMIKNSVGVLLDRGCLGRNLMGLFAGFLIAFPGSIKSKLWYIPAGLGIIFLLNNTRIMLLVWITLTYPKTHFDHHAVYNYTIYTLIFIMWYFWISRYSSVKNEKKLKT